jgi:uncharacterized membrane protein
MPARNVAIGSLLRVRATSRVARIARQLKRIPFPLTFVILALPVGVFLVFAQPPGQGLDEAVHFYRVWTLAHGAIVAPSQHGHAGGYIPQCVLHYFNQFSTHASQRGPFSVSQYWQGPTGCSPKPVFADFPGSAVYSPIAYIPSVIAVAILHGLGAPFPVTFFGGRLASLVTFVSLFYLAIRITPTGKQVLFVLGLLPTTLLLASGYSADPMTISLAALGAALALRCCRSLSENRSTVLALFVVLVGLALTKPTNFIFAVLLFMVPARALGRFRRPLMLKSAGVLVILVCAGLWYLAVRHVQGAPVPVYGINPHTQMRYILDHPIGYIGVLARTLFESTGEQRWLPGFFFSIGFPRPFNADNIYAPLGLVIVGALTLWYAFRLQFGPKRIIDQGTRLLIWLPIASIAVGILLIETALFVYGTPAGLPEVNVEGRYFDPLLALSLVSIGLWRDPRVARHSTPWIFFGSGLMLIWLVLKVFVHDYTL